MGKSKKRIAQITVPSTAKQNNKYKNTGSKIISQGILIRPIARIPASAMERTINLGR